MAKGETYMKLCQDCKYYYMSWCVKLMTNLPMIDYKDHPCFEPKRQIKNNDDGLKDKHNGNT